MPMGKFLRTEKIKLVTESPQLQSSLIQYIIKYY